LDAPTGAAEMTIEESRAQFEAAMTGQMRSSKKVLNPFQRYPDTEQHWCAGRYVRDDMEARWQGWELHRRTVSEWER
jgi:hypothetical protein